jgi:membrane-bound lytic murein transglycosylase A
MAARRDREQRLSRLAGGTAAAVLAVVLSVAALRIPAMANDLPKLDGAEARPLTFADIADWAADDHLAAFNVFREQCAAITRSAPSLRPGAPAPPALVALCGRADVAAVATSSQARAFFERWFTPHEIRPASGAGFLTGYYEPETEGSLVRTSVFTAPLLSRPDDVETIPQRETRPGVPEGFAAARRNPDGSFAPYADRGAILDGAMGERARPILWLRDDVEVFFMQVQGSGRVRLPDGRTVRIAYSGRNGHPYTSIGRAVVREGLMSVEDASLDKLKAWLRANPAEGRRIMRLNASYVFFRLADELSDAAGPIGGAGLPLTPWRSIAIDRSVWAYGLPVWLDVDLPAGGGVEPFRKLTITQDTGAAILGPARADLYHGSGATAGSRAGVLRHPMRFVVLWPKPE